MAKVVEPPKEIRQTELSEFIVLKNSATNYTKLRTDLIDRVKRGATTEQGALAIAVNTDDGHSVSYKSILDALVEAHPALKKEKEKLARKFTNPKVSNEVIITPSTP